MIEYRVGVLVLVSVLALTALSGCDLKMPWDPAKPDPATEETSADGEESGETGDTAAEGEGGDGEGDAAPVVKKPAPPTYNHLKDFPTTTVSVTAEDGFTLNGKLYDPWQVAHPPKPPAAEGEEGDPEEATAEEGDGDSEDGEAAPAPKPIKPTVCYPLVVVLHGLGGDANDWADWIPSLVHKGYAVLALDIRGHGQSTHIMATGYQPWRLLDPVQWAAASKDMDQWLRFSTTQLFKQAPQVKGQPMALMGVGLGANLALIGAGNHPDWVDSVVAMAPGLDYKGLAPAVPMLQFGKPIFFVASQSDEYSLSSAEKLYKIAQGPKQLRLFKEIGIGLDMPRNYPPLKAELLGWLAKNHPPVPPPKGVFPSTSPPVKPAPVVKNKQVETKHSKA